MNIHNPVRLGQAVVIRPDLIVRLRRLSAKMHVPMAVFADQALREYLRAVEGGRAAFQEIK